MTSTHSKFTAELQKKIPEKLAAGQARAFVVEFQLFDLWLQPFTLSATRRVSEVEAPRWPFDFGTSGLQSSERVSVAPYGQPSAALI
jgi:hypothetical protein